MEHIYSGSLLEGLRSVPEPVVQELIGIPVDQPLRGPDVLSANTALSDSVYFCGFALEPQTGMDPTSVWIRWTLTERILWDEPAAIDRVSIEGNSVYDDELLGALIGTLPVQVEDNYDVLALVKGVHDRYVSGGYSMIELSVSSIEDGELQLAVAEGEISQIALTGNTRTYDYVIERNSELEVGDVFNRQDLVVSYQQLMSLGYFASVDIVPEWGDAGIEVTIVVTEKSDLGGLGGSMAIDPSTGELFGELSLHEKNLFGTGQDLELSYSRGLVGTEDSKPSAWNLGYSTVAYFPEFSRVGLDFYQKTKETVVDEIPAVTITLGGEASFSYPVADYS
ncbi:hypothetical protein KAR02_15015, partial [Candidatus Bipolaricaulota bacterium]|nr:hypothetical protein [Candidatus Bipolaricaulota bacterium]